MKKVIALCLVLILCFSIAPYAFGAESEISEDEKIQIEGKYYAEDILAALENESSGTYSTASTSNTILSEVLMPVSMDITIPNIDPSKVYQTVDVYTLDPAFADALAAHGIYETSMTYSEYEALENTWVLPIDFIESAKYVYPELENIDMSTWTYGMYKEYCKQTDEERFLETLTSEQLQQIQARGILTSDLNHLLKKYYTIDNILEQPDQELKNTIESAYRFTYDKLSAETASAQSVPLDLYTYVYFPRFRNGAGEYFLNSVLTTTYWQNVQADRALKMQQCLYGVSSTTLHCTSLHGTYTDSVGGAHEGIDFVHPNGISTPTIYAIFRGVKLNTNKYHQLSVYDANSNLGARTYTYYHMSSITAPSMVEVFDAVGKQGTEEANGYHVHFEVHSGQTIYLSFGNDDVIESITPYGMQEYTGCLVHTYSWTYNASYHWKVCSVCGVTSAQSAHTYSNGTCTSCGRPESVSTANKTRQFVTE